MTDRNALASALAPVLEVVRGIDPSDPQAAKQKLDEALPLEGEALRELATLVRRGVQEGWLCDREGAPGIRYSRVLKADQGGGLSVDCVHMSVPGPGHTHPNGEIDLCFAVSGAPRFDGNPPGWTVYPPGSWHVPAVEGGAMDILYFLPGGAIEFGPNPRG